MVVTAKFIDGRDCLVEGHVEELIERIMKHAEMTSKRYSNDNEDPFNNGMAQAYSEICDIIGSWAELSDIELSINLSDWAAENLG